MEAFAMRMIGRDSNVGREERLDGGRWRGVRAGGGWGWWLRDGGSWTARRRVGERMEEIVH